MTFFIVLFIVLMQFLWRYIDDLVGKGLEMSVIAELFFYAAVTMVPMALPLAILLASLMTFGNFGEKFGDGDEGVGGIIASCDASADSAYHVCIDRGVLFPEQRIAHGTGEDVDAALLHASEISGGGDSGGGIL